jgi:predicted esterase
MNRIEAKITMSDILVLLLFLAVLAIPTYFAYTILFPRVEIFDNEEEIIEQEEKQNDVEEVKEDVFDTPHYEEIYETIEEQVAYIAAPKKTTEVILPTIVVYSHGSNTQVTMNTEDPFMQDLELYGESFTKNNYIFAASNQHGANWGNSQSIQDTLNMVEWIKENYDTQEKIYMIGYSMGGLPTMNFTTTYPGMVEKIALLAPTTYSTEWNTERVGKISDIDIQIWHGTADVNVPYSLSTTFVNRLSTLGREIPLVTIEGIGHWDLDTEYIDELIEYFSSNL